MRWKSVKPYLGIFAAARDTRGLYTRYLMRRSAFAARYLDAARKAADFLWRVHRRPGGGLYRASNQGVALELGVLDGDREIRAFERGVKSGIPRRKGSRRR